MSRPTRRFRRKLIMLTIVLIFLAPVIARASLYALSNAPLSWRDADWSSSGALPPAAQDNDARLLVFTGTTGGWKGVLSVHSWIVFKRDGDRNWTRYDMVGWGNPLRTNGWAPDGRWYGNAPQVLADVRGPRAEPLIPKVEAAIAGYRYRNAGDYRIWPGPNSNSFTAAVLRAVPELQTTLPPNAVGRDYRDGFYAGATDSGTGVELNLGGYAGMKLGWVEGVEVNLFGLVAGLDLRHPGVKLPGFGRVGFDVPAATAQSQ
jgi:hypothetical protein